MTNFVDSRRGAAYVFERNRGGADLWAQVKKLTASDGAASDLFGFSVSISCDTIVVGSVADDTGSSYIFGFIDTAPVITCPADITQGNDPGQCGGVVNFTVMANDHCDGAITPTCMPASGSFFPVGITSVSCSATDSAGNSSQCSFGVTIKDTEDPVISCPPDITFAGTPGQPTVAVNYTAPSVGAGTVSDNCEVTSVVCNPPSGSAFPLGTTTVTCTATDTSSNTASCSFTVTAFDVCVQDDSSSSKVLLWNSHTGDYLICFNGTTLSGKGLVTRKGNLFGLTHNAGDRRLSAAVDNTQFKGTASLQPPPGVIACTITDRNTRNNSCKCP